MARLIADAPNLKAAVDTNDPPTVQHIAERLSGQIESDLLLVTEPTGQVLARVGGSPTRRRQCGRRSRTADSPSPARGKESRCPLWTASCRW